MKAGVYYGPGDVRLEEMGQPRPGPGEIVVRVRTCGLCGTDVAKYRLRLVKPPVVLGHEVAGEVADIGQGVAKFRAGDRMVVPHHIPCFTCRYCRHGNFSNCAAWRTNQFHPGGFAEYVLVGAPAVTYGALRISDALAFDAAALVESFACCLRAMKRSRLQAGDSLAVIGCGPVGLMHLMLARALGAGVLIAVDVVDERLRAARELGAGLAVNPGQGDFVRCVHEALGGDGADHVIVAAGTVRAIETGIRLARRGGTVNAFAECPTDSALHIDPNLLYHSEVSLIGAYSSSPTEMAEALAMIESGRIAPESLITHRFPLAHLQEAFDLAVKGRSSRKIVINP